MPTTAPRAVPAVSARRPSPGLATAPVNYSPNGGSYGSGGGGGYGSVGRNSNARNADRDFGPQGSFVQPAPYSTTPSVPSPSPPTRAAAAPAPSYHEPYQERRDYQDDYQHHPQAYQNAPEPTYQEPYQAPAGSDWDTPEPSGGADWGDASQFEAWADEPAVTQASYSYAPEPAAYSYPSEPAPKKEKPWYLSDADWNRRQQQLADDEALARSMQVGFLNSRLHESSELVSISDFGSSPQLDLCRLESQSSLKV